MRPATRPSRSGTRCEREVRARGGCPYGLEALEFLRIEKGHIVIGVEADGRTTPHDLRLERMLRKNGGFIGASALDRPALSAPDRLQLVGLEAGEGAIPEGAMLVTATGGAIEGHVTSAAGRVLGDGAIALGLLAGGRAREGDVLAGVVTDAQPACPGDGDRTDLLRRARSALP